VSASEAVIGLEVHAELETKSKMFCSCPVVDVTQAEPNLAVCAVCAGMPGVLPVLNRRAVEYAVRVALALNCQIAFTSIFARKNYFYPDLPKGYQISQYDTPLARNGYFIIQTGHGERKIRIRRVHMEEDTGKLTHVEANGELEEISAYSLIDLNRAGIPLLEIVTEPDFNTSEEVRAYAVGLRTLLRYLGVNSGDMQKGVLRIEPNVSVRKAGSSELGTRVEIKNLNSLRALERSIDYEIQRQIDLLEAGQPIRQETLGWDVNRETTFVQRVKEGEDDYRYFPEPDLPPLVIDPNWVEEIERSLPELPYQKVQRFKLQYGLNAYDAEVLVAEKATADYFENVLKADPKASPKIVANWVSGELFSLLHQTGGSIETSRVRPESLAELIRMVISGEINNTTAKTVLGEMYTTGKEPSQIVSERGLRQIVDQEQITHLVLQVLDENPEQTRAYLSGKETISRWFFGQIMRVAEGQANPQLVQKELDQQLQRLKKEEK
jgi:aspartyl-tRNA(Asn)/glutamyl-tRNA(Gln) amidotransferase subunit B